MMISMRYARNLAHGYGLVWNAGGERVEGYTNLLWTLYMALIHLVPLAASKISVLIQITGAVCILATLLVVKKIAEVLSPSLLLAAGAMLLTGFYLPLNNWALLGTEVGCLTLLYSLAVYFALKNLKAKRADALPFVFLGITTLVRLDMAGGYLGILVLLLVLDRAHWRTHLGWGLGLLVLFVVPQTLFRVAYYGDVLPNTYYLKMTGFPEWVRIEHGLFVAGQFVTGSRLLFILAAAAFIWRRDRMMLLLGGAFCIPFAYSIYVGGDAWEEFGGSNRYISVGIPILFVLAMFTLSELVERVRTSPQALKWGGVAAGIALFLALLTSLNMMGTRPGAMWLLQERSLAVGRNLVQMQLALDLQRVTKPEARIAVVLAGVVPYFTNRYMIDLLGKSDKKIARQPMHYNPEKPIRRIFYPGHLKWNFEYSIDELKPDVVMRLWDISDEATLERLTPTYTPTRLTRLIFIRADSNAILWEQVAAAQP